MAIFLVFRNHLSTTKNRKNVSMYEHVLLKSRKRRKAFYDYTESGFLCENLDSSLWIR